jgi:hypothetical protein
MTTLTKKSRQRCRAFACNLIGKIEEPQSECMARIVSGFEATSALPIMKMIQEESRLKHDELGAWLRNRIEGNRGSPYPFKMTRGPFTGSSLLDPNPVDLSAVVATSETALWAVANFTPIPANYARSGQTFELIATGIYSTGASGTLIITPRYGTTTGGVTLGASVTQTVPINLSAEAWFMHAILNFRKVDASAATQSTAMAGGVFSGGGIAGTAGSSCVVAFGGTAGTVDTTAAAGLFIGWTLSVAGSCTPKIVFWRDT